ncbi:glutamyl-tRNA reductase [Goodfellowiella coeruleoviolacea]|uniref:Glutamyl-tRNA reductase n=1 Tax=Goodfellowiella coeruleoviolacea TaxID=334858 RepID=A0AAE3GES4_9PSEU|nr:glutamyl-tRNA reductase [Goodfellowiella coeruleoviolacea]MCP2165989.1 glutamyl-tRNA reductase [Goodfellowiella coeruleoviolacea]
MSVLVVGLSHRTAPVRTLERTAIAPTELDKVLHELLRCDNVAEVMALSTCNRVEVYALVETFHGGLTDISDVLARQAGTDAGELYEHLYVHYAAGAVEHLFSVAAGLDSMVVGEAQILGQLRTAYGAADNAGTVGRTLHELVQQALRVGKRVHAETDIDQFGASVVTEALDDAREVLPGGLAGRRALVVGAGSMGGLAAAHLRRAGIGEVVVANRTPDNGARLAASLRAEGVSASSVGLDALAGHIAAADVLIACTGATDVVISADLLAEGLAGRDAAAAPLVVCDLGLPKDVDPAAEDLPGVRVVDLATLQRRLSGTAGGARVQLAGRIIAEEVRGYLARQRSAEVTPTVTALRRRAAEVVDAELLRLDSRLPHLEPAVRGEVAKTVRRVVDKLLHTPTVRVKQLAATPAGSDYAEALRELFGLTPQTTAAVSDLKTAAGLTTAAEVVAAADASQAIDTGQSTMDGENR